MATSPIDPQTAYPSTAISDPSRLQSLLLNLIAFSASSGVTEVDKERIFFGFWYLHYPDLFCRNLAVVLRSSSHAVRSLVAPNLARMVDRADGSCVWDKLSDNDKKVVKINLLICVELVDDGDVYEQVSRMVVAIARSVLADKEGWPDLFTLLVRRVKGDDRTRVRALEIVGHLASVGECLVPHLDELKPALVRCFEEGSGLDVRIVALNASTQLLFFLRSHWDRDSVGGLLPLMVRTMVEGLCFGWEPSAVHMGWFVSLVRNDPRLSSKELVSVLGAMMQIAVATEFLEGPTWRGAIEFIVALSETGVEFAKVMGNLHGFIHELLSILMRTISDVEDDPIWESADEDKAVSHDFRYCENCIFRVSVSLGGNTIVPVALELLPAYLNSPDWKRRHAAIICLSQVAQGQLMTNNLEKLLSMLLRSFCDPDPRVGCAAINAVVILFGYLEPDLKLPFHSLALPALVLAMADAQNPRLQASAASAVCQISNNVEQNALRPHLDDLVDKLCVLLQNAKQMVRMGALDALTSVADSSKAVFQKHYDSVMPVLKAILVDAPEESNDVLRAKLLGCIITVGVVAGKEKFKDDSKQTLMLELCVALVFCS
ncbi:hypothetical protein Drorol1_Dr00007627 [Drosera rotundifolia]